MKILYWLVLRARGLFTIYTKHSCRSGSLTAKRSVFFFGLILVAAPVFAVIGKVRISIQANAIMDGIELKGGFKAKK